jgi:thiamine-phosphate pyrophosphorylase
MSARFSETIMATNLANRRFHLNARTHLGAPLVLMTDDRRADWAKAARGLPKGSLVVVRARDDKHREALARQLKAIAPILIADDPKLAMRVRAVGLHLPQARMTEALHWRSCRPQWIITASAHSLRALMMARGLDAVFLSPVFSTTSHRQAKPLTPVRAAFIAARAQVPVYALGGITGLNTARVAPVFSGIAAITSLL